MDVEVTAMSENGRIVIPASYRKFLESQGGPDAPLEAGIEKA